MSFLSLFHFPFAQSSLCQSVQSVILLFNHSRNHVLSFTFSFSIFPVIRISVINTLLRPFTIPYVIVRSSGSSAYRYGRLSWVHIYRGVGRRGLQQWWWGGGAYFFAFSRTIPLPLSRFNTHTQAKLRTFETRMAARSAKRAISSFLRKNRWLWTVNTLRSFFVQLFFIRRVPLCIETSSHLFSLRPSAVDFF